MSFDLKGIPTHPVTAGTVVRLEASDPLTSTDQLESKYELTWTMVGPFTSDRSEFVAGAHYDFDTTGRRPGAYEFRVRRRRRDPGAPGGEQPDGGGVDVQQEPRATELFPPKKSTSAGRTTTAASVQASRGGGGGDPDVAGPWVVTVNAPAVVNPEGVVPVSLQRTGIEATPDQVLWPLIRNRTNAIGFRAYKQFIDGVMCRGIDVRSPGSGAHLNFTGTQAYEVLRQATEAFLMQECGIIEPPFQPQEFLDVELSLQSIEDQLAAPDGSRLAGEEGRRLNRGGPISIDDLRTLRAAYFEALGNEQAVMLPYLRIITDRLGDIPLKGPNEIVANCYGILRSKVTGPPALELIWSYWIEEGMVVQTLNAILARFQNRRLAPGLDPLARLDLDPLRPLSNLFWGWAEDETHRLTVRRRAYEYDHEYGLKLLGRAVPRMRTVDSRSRFLESFHTLLHVTHAFFKEDDDTTVIADGFPLLNALRETHLLLAEGAHNQYGDLPSTARAEMLIMQWLLARPEMREFLGGRVMVPYEEEWEDRVDTMKSLQGWTDVSITHFRDLAVFGEQIILSIRYGNWSVVNDPQQAANWARYWRPELQRYVHAYRAATGIDLTSRVDATLPAYLLRRRLPEVQRRA